MTEEYCEVCGKLVSPLPYVCNYCGGIFCAEHRLPEKHNCKGLRRLRTPSFSQPAESLSQVILEFERAERGRKEGFFSRLKRKLSGR